MDMLLKDHERLDDLQCRGLMLIQDPSRFCFGVDAVLLAHFALVHAGDRVMDLCSGNGIIPVLLSGISEGEHFTGLEIQPENVDMAVRSVNYNHLNDRVDMIQGDVREAAEMFPAASFHVVTCNPPYMPAGGGLKNEYGPRVIARHEVMCTWEDVVSSAAKLLRPGGRFYAVHKPFRLPELMRTMEEHGIEPKRLRFVHPYADKEPGMVLLGGVRGGKPMCRVEPPLIIYSAPHQYTDEVLRIYKSGTERQTGQDSRAGG